MSLESLKGAYRRAREGREAAHAEAMRKQEQAYQKMMEEAPNHVCHKLWLACHSGEDSCKVKFLIACSIDQRAVIKAVRARVNENYPGINMNVYQSGDLEFRFSGWAD